MFRSVVFPHQFGFLNRLKQPKRRRLQSQSVGFGDSLEIRLLLTGPQLVNPTSDDGIVVTDVVSDHGGFLTVNVDVDGDGIYEIGESAVEGDTLVLDLTPFVAPNTSQNITLQIVESADIDEEGIETGPEMSNSMTLNVAGITVLATEFEWIHGEDSAVTGAVDMTNSIGATEVIYRVPGDTGWNTLGEISDNSGSFFFYFDLADGETDFEFAVAHTYMGATVLSSAVTITDMTPHTSDEPAGVEPGDTAPEDVNSPSIESVIDDLFADLFA
ncbi:MAG: hypothetical protein GY903_31200 [Fuerstiella sp.]|nr:hypothetical protein [Fuerstiella sp.]MCP4858960.1 hypothetical protein [Fuerstiella sp.]